MCGVSLDVFAGREASHTKASTVNNNKKEREKKRRRIRRRRRGSADVESACHHERHDSTVALSGH